jgi:hypothetical protein
MAKVSIKFEKIIPFGEIFHVRELFPVTFSRYVGPFIDTGITVTVPVSTFSRNNFEIRKEYE